MLGWPSDTNGPLMSETNRWLEITNNDPDHSTRYIERFEKMAREGRDLDGEARFIDAMVGRGSRILDAGCGPGRVGGKIFELGHTVVGMTSIQYSSKPQSRTTQVPPGSLVTWRRPI